MLLSLYHRRRNECLERQGDLLRTPAPLDSDLRAARLKLLELPKAQAQPLGRYQCLSGGQWSLLPSRSILSEVPLHLWATNDPGPLLSDQAESLSPRLSFPSASQKHSSLFETRPGLQSSICHLAPLWPKTIHPSC